MQAQLSGCETVKTINYRRLKDLEDRVSESSTYINGITERENKKTEIEAIMSENFPKLMKNFI